MIGRLVRRFARSQAGLARALWWTVRGRVDVGPGDVALPYNGLDRVLLWTLVVLGVLETAVVHVLVSWPPLRWTLLALGVYGLLAFVAFDGTLRQRPHLLRGGELVLRFGHFRTVRVRLDTLTAVRKHVTGEHKRTVEVGGDGLAVSFMGETHVELRFSPPAEAEIDGRTTTVTTVSFAAHDARAAVPLLRARMPSSGHDVPAGTPG
ncbi:hypothetical protein E4P40_18410 [Blastococcus sp. CT_GayMR20]|uniref:hypothetical protein n=1 Tax=Blastococcus sp. CT_GayMR20 TaxID=2559609 RepID=UPI001073EC26|nr:hypothetical protein [Blastococcus sp. CT_GayMR20]TFV79083.1 hypothetical protein E4P40_18410 [Blastococcus sp. CT_GayMR20]